MTALPLVSSTAAFPNKYQALIRTLEAKRCVISSWRWRSATLPSCGGVGTLQPDFQYIVHPGGNVLNANGTEADDAAVFGVRTTLNF